MPVGIADIMGEEESDLGREANADEEAMEE